MKSENIVKGSYRNIVEAYNNASPESHREGLRWYQDAHDIAKQISAILDTDDVRVGAGILAALSPSLAWDANVADAFELVRTGHSFWQTKANEDKAILIACGQDPLEILGGLKVVPFYLAIVDPTGDDLPVVDRHVEAIYYGKPVSEYQLKQVFGNGKVVRRTQHAVKRAAKQLNLHYNELQAIVWVQHRKNKDIERAMSKRISGR